MSSGRGAWPMWQNAVTQGVTSEEWRWGRGGEAVLGDPRGKRKLWRLPCRPSQSREGADSAYLDLRSGEGSFTAEFKPGLRRQRVERSF